MQSAGGLHSRQGLAPAERDESLLGGNMSKTIYYSLIFGALLMPNCISVPFKFAPKNVYAYAADMSSTITNDIAVTTTSEDQKTSGNDGLDGSDGANGRDGTDGLDGADGPNNQTLEKAQALVKVINVVDGKEVTESTIDVQTSSSTSATVEKFQSITDNNGETSVQNMVRVIETGEAASDADAAKTVGGANNNEVNIINDSKTGNIEPPLEQQHIVEDEAAGLLSTILDVVFASLVSIFNSVLSIF